MPVSWSRKNPTVVTGVGQRGLERLQRVFGDADGDGFQRDGMFGHSGALDEPIEHALVAGCLEMHVQLVVVDRVTVP